MNDNLEMIQRIESLCKTHSTDVKNMLLSCGLNRSAIDNMKKGSAPAINKIEKIADYFNVSVDYLLGRTDIPDIENDNDAQLFNLLKGLSDVDKADFIVAIKQKLSVP